MASKASIAGHPVHPMIIPFPLALWTTSFVADLLFYYHAWCKPGVDLEVSVGCRLHWRLSCSYPRFH